MPHLHRTALLGLAAATAGAVFTPAAEAQFGQAAGFGEVMNPYFMRRDIDLVVDWLDLDQSQGVIVESLFFDYEDAHAASRNKMIDSFRQLSDELDDMDRADMLRIVMKPFEEKAEEWESQRSEFLENVQLLLGPAQIDEWPTFVRKLRRYKDLPKGEFAGEHVDLFIVLDRLKLEEWMLESLAGLLNEYELALDDVLRAREDSFRDSRLAMMHALRDEDHGTSLRLYDEQLDRHMGVRNVNDDYREVIAAALSPEIGSKFRYEALMEGYPGVFRTTPAQRVFEAALQHPSLDEETMAAIVDLNNAFLDEIAIVNENLLAATRRHEPVQARHRAEKFAARTDRPGERIDPIDDPTRAIYTERRDLGRQYIQMLRELMSPEDFAALPGASRFMSSANRGDFNNNAPNQNPGREKQLERKLRSASPPPNAVGGGSAGGGR